MKNFFLIISNDKLNIQGDKISSDYNDTINIIESLAKKNHLNFLCRFENKFKNFISKKLKYKNRGTLHPPNWMLTTYKHPSQKFCPYLIQYCTTKCMGQL